MLMSFFKLGFVENAFSSPAISGFLKAASFIIAIE